MREMEDNEMRDMEDINLGAFALKLADILYVMGDVEERARHIIEVEKQVRWVRGVLGKFLCDSDLLNLGKILGDLRMRHRLLSLEDLYNVVIELSDEIEKIFAPLANDDRESYAVVVAAVFLLSYVYLYLTGCGGWDASRAVSSGPLDYRDTYIAIVLFRGAYVWIKFRDVASTKPIPAGAIKPSGKDGRIKYEPRFKPPKDKNRLYLGRFDSRADAEVVYRMAASCYDPGKGYGTPLDLAGDGRELFNIIPEFTPAEKALPAEDKRLLVKERVEELFERYKTKQHALNLPPTLPGANLEQELENRRLRSEILREQQQKEDLKRQLQESWNRQQAQRTEIQKLQRQVQHQQPQQNFQQAQQYLLQAPQFQMEGLERQVQDPQAQQNFQQAPQFQFQFQDSQLPVEDLQCPFHDHQAQENRLQEQENRLQALQFRIEGLERQVQHPQAQQNLQPPQQFQVPNLQPQPQLPHLQPQQREEEPSPPEEMWNVFVMEPSPENAGFGAESTNF